MNLSNGIIRLGSLLLLVVLVIQISGLTCVGEDLSSGISQLKAYNQSDGSATDAHDAADTDDTGDLYRCPCHLSFTHTTTIAVTAFSPFVVPLTPSNHLFTKNISKTIFQPPRIVL